MDTREHDLVLLLRTSFAGQSTDVSTASARLGADSQPSDAPLLLSIATKDGYDYELQLSAAALLSKLVRLPVSLADANYLTEQLATAAVQLPRCRKSLRYYFEVAISLLAKQHESVGKLPLAVLGRGGGDSPGAASLLRLVLTRVVAREAGVECIKEYVPLLFEAGGALFADRGNEERLIDWLSQVSKILEYVQGNLPCERGELARMPSCTTMLETIVDFLLKSPSESPKLRKRAYKVILSVGELVSYRGTAATEFVPIFERVLTLIFTDLPQIDLKSEENRPLFIQLLHILSIFLSESMTFRYSDHLQSLLSLTVLPLLSPAAISEELCDSDPQEFISQCYSVCESDENTSLFASIGAFLREIAEKCSWGLRFIVSQAVLHNTGDLALCAVAEKAIDREDLVEMVENRIRTGVKSSEDMRIPEKCFFLLLISVYISGVFHDSPSDTEELVSFLIDSAGSLTSKAVSIQACATLSETFTDSETLLALENCLQSIASGLSQLIPVIRCKGLYECVRLLVVEGFDDLGSEGRELVVQLVHRVKIELQRFVFKRMHQQRHNSQLLGKCFSALRAAAERNLSAGTAAYLNRNVDGRRTVDRRENRRTRP